MSETSSGKPRGFGGMTMERRREISSKGGKTSHANGTAHKWTKEEARIAGKKGGMKASANRGAADGAVDIYVGGMAATAKSEETNNE